MHDGCMGERRVHGRARRHADARSGCGLHDGLARATQRAGAATRECDERNVTILGAFTTLNEMRGNDGGFIPGREATCTKERPTCIVCLGGVLKHVLGVSWSATSHANTCIYISLYRFIWSQQVRTWELA